MFDIIKLLAVIPVAIVLAVFPKLENTRLFSKFVEWVNKNAGWER